MEKLGSNLYKCSCGRIFFSEEDYIDHLEDDECTNYKQERWEEVIWRRMFEKATTRELQELREAIRQRIPPKEFLTWSDIIWSRDKYLLTAEDILHSKDFVKYDKRYFSIN
jgi:hypothetical protein